jgi:hypothetical protein
MKKYMSTAKVGNTGSDIVADLIDVHLIKHKTNNVNFIKIDLANDALSFLNIVISRDFMFHLLYDDYLKFIRNYIYSIIPFLTTTSHVLPQAYKYRDIKTGDFKLLNIFIEPCFFNLKPLCLFDVASEDGIGRIMGLWSRSQLIGSIKRYEEN